MGLIIMDASPIVSASPLPPILDLKSDGLFSFVVGFSLVATILSLSRCQKRFSRYFLPMYFFDLRSWRAVRPIPEGRGVSGFDPWSEEDTCC